MKKAKDIATDILNDISSKNPNQSINKNTLIYALIYSISSILAVLYNLADYLEKQIFPSSANNDSIEKYAKEFGLKRFEAKKGEALFSFKSNIGTVVPSGTEFKKGNITYLVKNTISTTQNPQAIPTISKEAGANQNLEIGDIFECKDLINGKLSDEVVALSIWVVPSDEETFESFKQRVINKQRYTPRGGSKKDFEYWAKNNSGVIGAYPYTTKLGELTVYIASDADDYLSSDAKLQTIKTSILYDEDGYFQSPLSYQEIKVVNVNIKYIYINILNANKLDNLTKTELSREINQKLRAKEPFIRGVSFEDNSSLTQGELISWIYEIAPRLGFSFSTLDIFDDASFSNKKNSWILGEGQKIILDEIRLNV